MSPPNQSRRRKAALITAALIAAPLLLALWGAAARVRAFYHSEPRAAYARVAQALRRGDRTALERLSLSDAAAEQLWHSAALRPGGAQALGESLAAPGAARRYTHMFLVVGFIVPGPGHGRQELNLLFQWVDGDWRLWKVHDAVVDERDRAARDAEAKAKAPKPAR